VATTVPQFTPIDQPVGWKWLELKCLRYSTLDQSGPPFGAQIMQSLVNVSTEQSEQQAKRRTSCE
jgi:hypothetical protein